MRNATAVSDARCDPDNENHAGLSTCLVWIVQAAVSFGLLMMGAARGQTIDDLFDDSILQEIRIQMDAADWRTLHENYLANTWYPCTVEWREIRLEKVSIRSRGSGSRNPIKPALGLDFTRNDPAQRLLTLKSLILRNFAQDPSMVHERLTERMFARMGLPHSREAHTKVFLNGEYVGLYMLVEPIDKRFLASRFGEDTGFLYEFSWTGSPYNFEYLGDDPSAYVPNMFEPKTREDNPEPEYLVEMIRTVNQAPDDTFVSSVRRYLDLDTFLVHVAVEQFMSEWDGVLGFAGMTNFYLYRRTSDNRFVFLVWDKDNSFSSVNRSVWENATNNVLMRRALQVPELKSRYLSALMQAAISAGGHGGWLENEALRAYTQIRDAARDDAYRVCLNGLEFVRCSWDAFEESNQAVQRFAATRSAGVSSEVWASGYTLPTGSAALEAGTARNLGSVDAVLTPGSLAVLEVPSFLREETAASFPLPRVMQGLSVRVAGLIAPLLSCKNRNITFQVPSVVPCGPQTASLEGGGATIGSTSVEVRPNFPFVLAATDLLWQPVDPEHPVSAGSTIVLFVTGLGYSELGQNTGDPAPLNQLVRSGAAVTAQVEDRPAAVLFAGLAPGLLGVQQIVIRLPEEVRNVNARLVLIADHEPGSRFLLPIR